MKDQLLEDEKSKKRAQEKLLRKDKERKDKALRDHYQKRYNEIAESLDRVDRESNSNHEKMASL